MATLTLRALAARDMPAAGKLVASSLGNFFDPIVVYIVLPPAAIASVP